MATYRIYIDESGDHIYGDMAWREFGRDMIGRSPQYYPHLTKLGGRYLGLTGVVIEKEYGRETFHPEIEALKKRHFHCDPDEPPLILHREDIKQRHRSFWRLRDEALGQAFDNDLIRLFSTLRYRIITVVLDKESHIFRHGSAAFHPYHYCLAALLERYCFLLQNTDSHGDVLAESRGRNSDMALKRAYSEIYSLGSNLRPSDFFQRRLTSKEIKVKPKSANIAGLQIADLLAAPSKREVLFEYNRIDETAIRSFDNRVFRAIRTKYHCNSFNGTINKFGRYLIT